MAELLVSVRSVAEAEAALAGGADLIDVKEPFSQGSLARASDETIAGVLRFVAGRRPVSAALGELMETVVPFPQAGVAYAKWGLAGCGARTSWRAELLRAGARVKSVSGCRPVAVAYADWPEVQAPPPTEVSAFACEHGWAAFLLDTGHKDGRTLLDWLSLGEIAALCAGCRQAGVRVALAGSLGVEQIRSLLVVEPDWFAVRGAACHQSRRGEEIDPQKVQRLAEILRGINVERN